MERLTGSGSKWGQDPCPCDALLAAATPRTASDRALAAGDGEAAAGATPRGDLERLAKVISQPRQSKAANGHYLAMISNRVLL